MRSVSITTGLSSPSPEGAVLSCSDLEERGGSARTFQARQNSKKDQQTERIKRNFM
jgi:hypothetical protein